MKPIFEPGDFFDLDCNHGELHSTVIAQAARIAEAKLQSLGIDAETPEKMRRFETELYKCIGEKHAIRSELELQLEATREVAQMRGIAAGEAEERVMGLERVIAEAPEIDVAVNDDGGVSVPSNLKRCTHRARLVQIEEI